MAYKKKTSKSSHMMSEGDMKKMMKKKMPKMRLGSKSSRFFIQDVADRRFQTEVGSVDLKAGVKTEVTRELAEHLKAAYPYLVVTSE